MIRYRAFLAGLLLLASCSAVSEAAPDIESQPIWEANGYQLVPGVETYSWDPPHGLDVDPTDEEGLHLYERNGTRFIHPVGQGQYVLLMLNAWAKTGETQFLDRAQLNLDSLIEYGSEDDGKVFYPYGFDFPLYGLEELTLHAPWWSSMAQGQILSALVRMYEATGDETYRQVADKTFASFEPRPIGEWPIDEPAVSIVDEDGFLWLEEYAGDLEPAYVLNGHIFAIYGLYDYWELTGSAEAAEMIDAAATSVANFLPEFRGGPDQLSWYGLTIKDNPRGQHAKYHRIHKEQLRTLAEMTDESLFSDYSNLLESDL